MPEIEKLSRTKAHTVYKAVADGKRVIGVTTALGVLAKPALGPWHNRMGLEGIDTSKYVDRLAGIGTLAHKMVECDFNVVSYSAEEEWSPEEIDRAENSVIKYFDWKKSHRVEPILVEGKLVSEENRYGGTCDCYALVDGVKTLIDIKTSKAIYPEHIMQVAAYMHLLEEHDYEVERVAILRIGRDESEGFEYREYSPEGLDNHWQIFLKCLEIYQLKKLI